MGDGLMCWVRYRHKSAGPADWEYRFYPWEVSSSDLEAIRRELHQEGAEFDERYRGVDVVRIPEEHVPFESINEWIETAQSNILYYQRMNDALFRQLNVRQMNEFNQHD